MHRSMFRTKLSFSPQVGIMIPQDLANCLVSWPTVRMFRGLELRASRFGIVMDCGYSGCGIP